MGWVCFDGVTSKQNTSIIKIIYKKWRHFGFPGIKSCNSFFNNLILFTMRSLLFILAFVFTSVLTYAQSQTWVNGYYKSDGTYVQGHYKQTPNSTNHDNWSTTQQRNPYTLDNGSRAKDYSSDTYNYGSGQTIYTGPRGGQYYINSNGNKVYVPKRN